MLEKRYIYRRMQDEFTKTFYGEIAPKIKKFEFKRICNLTITIILASMTILAALLIVYTSLSNYGYCSDEEIMSVLLSFLIAFSICHISKNMIENEIKDIIMPTICKCFGNLEWDRNSYDSSSLFSIAKIIDDYDCAKFDDIFYGNFNGINFDIVESKFTKGSVNKRGRTVFDGVIVKFDMNKCFNGHTIIRPNSHLHTSPSPILKHTELEDVDFEKRFDVFTDDEVEARYLITPSFMERLNEMKVAFKADKVSCAFYNKYLFVALQTPEDLFSICSLFKRVDDPKQFFTMFEEILSIIKLIDHFKLDQKIGL